MSTDLVLVESASLRREHMDRTDALSKAKALFLLPDGLHVTSDMLANYYEIPAGTLDSLVREHKAELTSNGYRTLTGAELRAFATLNSQVANLVGPKTRKLAVFTLSTILNVGMLLRDSHVARDVRSEILKRVNGPSMDLSTPSGVLVLAEQFADCARQLVAAEARAEEGEQFKRAIEAGDGLTFREFHKKYFSEVPDRVFFEHLYKREWVVDGRGKGLFDPKTGKTGASLTHKHPKAKGKPYLYLHNKGHRGEDGKWETTYVRRGRWELALRDLLAGEGLQPNEQPGLFAIEAA